MRAKIHRGTQEIGGSCIELQAASGERLVFDLGRPLWAGWDDQVELPLAAGFREPDPTLLGVVISHPHLDHYGLVADLPVDVPLWIGREAASIVEAAAFFSSAGKCLQPSGFLEHRVPLQIGPFTITPHLNDHSAFDAYSLLVECDGRRLFYTGDLRSHGRKARLFTELVEHPPEHVDLLLMEGTHVRANSGHDAVDPVTESDLERQLAEAFRTTSGSVVVAGSAQNLDRLVTVYRAARATGRQLVVDLYGATVAAAARSTIPQPGFPDLRVWLPQRQRVLVKTAAAFERTAWVKPNRVFAEQLLDHPERFAFHVPSSALAELVRAGVLTADGLAVWSLWEGYLSQPSGQRLTRSLTGIPFSQIHTSGHASVAALQTLARAIDAKRVVPIHTEAGDRFSEFFERVDRQPDGAWWDV